jgi:hypothetical protein
LRSALLVEILRRNGTALAWSYDLSGVPVLNDEMCRDVRAGVLYKLVCGNFWSKKG